MNADTLTNGALALFREWSDKYRNNEADRDIRGDYDAAKASRFVRTLTGTSSVGSGADYHNRNETEHIKIIERARNLDRNSDVIAQAIDRVVDNILQNGIRLDVDSGDEELNTYIQRKWQLWCEDPDQCHTGREMTFEKLARLALRQTIVDGDIVFLATNNGSLQPIEAHRIRSPHGKPGNVVLGVEQTPERERIRYHIADEDIDPNKSGGYTGTFSTRPVRVGDTRVLMHVFDPARVTQTRGISALAPIMNTAGMLDDIQFATLVKAQMSASFAIIEERSIDFEATQDPQFGLRTTNSRTDGSNEVIENIQPGMIVRGAPGAKLTGFSPDIPSATYKEHVMLMLTIIAVNLGIPVHVLLLDPSNTNFSGWRGAIDEARKGFVRKQNMLVERLHAPVFRWKMRNWLAEDDYIAGRIDADPSLNPFGALWNPPRWNYIDPLKDANADATVIKNRLNSPRGVLASRGLDIDRIHRETVSDQTRYIRLCIEASESIKSEYPGEGVTWRDIAQLDATALPDGVPMTLPKDDPSDEPA